MAKYYKDKSLLQKFNDYKVEYAATQPSRFRRTRRQLGGSGDSHYLQQHEFRQLREYAQDMDRNDWAIGPMVDQAVTNTIQDGFSIDPDTGDKELNNEIKLRWNKWAKNPELASLDQEMTFTQMEEKVLRHTMVDGDIFVHPISNGSLELIESHRAQTPPRLRRKNVIHGVEINTDTRQRINYWFAKNLDPRFRAMKISDITQIPAREGGQKRIFHVFDPKRVTQTRGVTAFHAVQDIAGMAEDLNFSNIVRAQFASAVVWFLKRDKDFKSLGGDLQLGSRQEIIQEDQSTNTIEEIGPGQFVRGQIGESLEGVAPKVPNPEFMPHIKFLLQAIGINIGMPLVLFLMDATETNFSGWRGALDTARMGFRRNQRWMIEKFHTPVYMWRIRHWIATDPAFAKMARAVGDKIFNHTWNRPGWPYVQPLQDAQADAVSLSSMLESPRMRAARRGHDFEKIAKETAADNQLAITEAIKASQAIKKETNVDVHWRDLLHQNPPKGLKIFSGTIDGSEPQEAEE